MSLKNRWIRKHTHKYIMCRYITYIYIHTCKTPKPTKQKPVLPLPTFFLMPPSQLFSSPGGWVIVKAKLENRNLWIYTVMLNRFPNALCKSTVNHQETYMLMCFFYIRIAIFATTSWIANHWVPKPKPETGCAKNLALQKGQPFNGGPFTWKSCPQSLEMNRLNQIEFLSFLGETKNPIPSMGRTVYYII